MKIDLSEKDWFLYLVMFLLSLAFHLGILIALMLMPSQSPTHALEGNLVAPQGDAKPTQSEPELQDALLTWKSRLSGQLDALKVEVQTKARSIEEHESPVIEAAWTKENTAKKILYYTALVGVELSDIELEAQANGSFSVVGSLNSTPKTVFSELALLSHLVGTATTKSRFKSAQLKVAIYDSQKRKAGSFELSTQGCRDFSKGHKTLRELFDEGLRFDDAPQS